MDFFAQSEDNLMKSGVFIWLYFTVKTHQNSNSYNRLLALEGRLSSVKVVGWQAIISPHCEMGTEGGWNFPKVEVSSAYQSFSRC